MCLQQAEAVLKGSVQPSFNPAPSSEEAWKHLKEINASSAFILQNKITAGRFKPLFIANHPSF